MKNRTLARQSRLRLATWVVAFVTLVISLCQFLPIFIALRAGIAALSLVVFTPLLLIALVLAYLTWHHKLRQASTIALLSALIALLAMIAPVLSFAAVANREGASLSLDLGRYLAFTGDSIRPSKTLVYKTVDDQPLSLALYSSDANTLRPTVLLLHGGGWQYGDYRRTNQWPKIFTDAGYQVISIEYRLASTDRPTWDKSPQDVADAVRYIKEHASSLGVDTEKLAIFGQSAGGHLGLLEASRSHSVQAAIGLYTPTDLSADYELSVDKSTELAFLGGPPAALSKRYEIVSVQRAVTPLSPPTLLVQGTNDDIVHHSSSTRLAEVLEDAGVGHRVVLLPYTGHSFDNQVGGFATQIAEQVVLDFLDSTLR